VMSLDRRKILHVNVTKHPTAEWTAQQLVEAFADRQAPRFLQRDNDGAYESGDTIPANSRPGSLLAVA